MGLELVKGRGWDLICDVELGLRVCIVNPKRR